MSLLDSLHPKQSLGHEWLIEPPPTFPFLKSQCQTARRPRRFARQNSTITPRSRESREAAWARVIGAGSRRVKRKNRQKSGVFQGPVDGPREQKAAAGQPPI